MSKQDGGRQNVFVTDGMSLRDWFAGQALITVLTHWPSAPASVNARRAYTIADAMIAAREA